MKEHLPFCIESSTICTKVELLLIVLYKFEGEVAFKESAF